MNLQSMKRPDVPLHAEVSAVLRNQILSGGLTPGSQLPALRELTEQLGVARMTVVQAMNTLEDEGLIERHAGRGTFVRDVKVAERHSLQMKAPLSQLQAMVDQLEVSVLESADTIELVGDRPYRIMRRIHAKDGLPFCQVDLKLDEQVFERAPKRFASEIVVKVLNDLGVSIKTARQSITIAYADFDLAQALDVRINSAVFRVFREFFDASGQLIYSATLAYPGDSLSLEIEFAV